MTPPAVLTYPAEQGDGWSLRVFPNMYPAVAAGAGFHEVIIESPLHHASLGDLSERAIEGLFRAVQERMLTWKAEPEIAYVQWFKNSGEAAGASLEHPHSQLMTLPMVPRRVQEELTGAKTYFEQHAQCAFCGMLRRESGGGERLVLETEQIEAIAPWAPRFGYETWILPKAHASDFCRTNPTILKDLAGVVRRVMRALDQARERPAYNLILHTAPLREPALDHYHWHLELLPRIAGVAGFEWATGYHINAVMPEDSARRLREWPTGRRR